jgi:ABC-type transport system involved in cytochrome c biogenesis permease subunit
MEFQKQVMAAHKQAPSGRTLQQRKLLELRQRVDRYRLLADAFRPTAFPSFPTKEETANDREDAVKRVAAIKRLMKDVPATSKALASRQPPLAAPVGAPDQPWRAYASAKNEAYRDQAWKRGEPAPALAKLSAIFEAYEDDNPAAFNAAVAEYKTLLANQPPEGLDVRITSFEAFFNRFAPFYHAIPLYALALVLTAFAWLSAVAWPRLSALMRSSTFWLIVLAFAVHTFALAARVVISGRPPVTNLYSSAVFVGWGCVGFGLLLELVFRLGIGNLVASVSGIGTLIIAHFLAADGDTIKVLQAVLDTQFWLTVHVITVTLGYSATFLAGLLGIVLIVWMLGKPLAFALNRMPTPWGGRLPSDWLSSSGSSEVVKTLAAMIYGTLCFAAFFSLVGTVLGGLWADDSWGRFWGWDPKENGALMVVLWNALILHALWSRMVKERGLALLAIGGNIVTGWSWFGVNELGVGLHSYGFTEGVARTLWLFWISQLIVIGLGILPVLVRWILVRRAPPMEPTAA